MNFKFGKGTIHLEFSLELFFLLVKEITIKKKTNRFISIVAFKRYFHHILHILGAIFISAMARLWLGLHLQQVEIRWLMAF